MNGINWIKGLILKGPTPTRGRRPEFYLWSRWVQFVASEGSDLDTSAAPAELLASLLFIPTSLSECSNTDDTPLWSTLMDELGRAGETEHHGQGQETHFWESGKWKWKRAPFAFLTGNTTVTNCNRGLLTHFCRVNTYIHWREHIGSPAILCSTQRLC